MIAIIRQFLFTLVNDFFAVGHKAGAPGSPRRGWALAPCLLLAGAATAFAIGKTAIPLPVSPPPPLAITETQEAPPSSNEPPPPLTTKQKQAIMKSNYEKLKRDADDLVSLAKSLQEEIGKGNENVLSLKVVGNAEKIEKLAKKIKNTAEGQ